MLPVTLLLLLLLLKHTEKNFKIIITTECICIYIAMAFQVVEFSIQEYVYIEGSKHFEYLLYLKDV